jgi:phytoene dehydrogenase-like protein
MPAASQYDAILIGAGHNALTAAAYLARAGRRVLALERRELVGGACVTEEVWPGYRVSTAAYVVSLFLPQITRELRLADYGFRVLPRNPSSFTPLADGRYLLLGADAGSNQREIAKFSARDAEAWPRYEALLERVAELVDQTLTTTPPDLLPLPRNWRRPGLGKRWRDLGTGLALLRAARRLGNDLPAAIELLTGAARPILDRWFESDVLKATLATDAIIGTMASISEPGTAYVLIHHVMGEAGGKRGVWGYVQGGMGSLSNALAQAARGLGAEIRCEAEVSRILVRNGQAQGVALADGTEVHAPVVASGADPHVTFERLLAADELPEPFLAAVRRIDYRSASMKINLALSELPDFRCLPGKQPGPQHQGTIHVGPSVEYLERAFDGVHAGYPSEEPILEVTLPSAVDPGIAPEGRYVMSMFVQYAPYRLAEGTWDDRKEAFADRCLEILGRYAPNVPGAVVHRQVLSPVDLERVFGLTGGNIFQGAMNPGQLFFLRPVAGWSDYRTPIRGLYLCGAAAHPGGGVIGACGYNAAREILRDGIRGGS